ncbi:MAG: hypothetical protein AAF321_01860 [Pseudomonadota bacterium]
MSTELVAKAAWLLLAALHVGPSLVLFTPALAARLYGVDPAGDVGVLVVHRGALFLAVVACALYAVFDLDARRVASIVLAVSMIGFLIVYARAGFPPGSLRTIAIADLVGLLPLTFAALQTWRT